MGCGGSTEKNKKEEKEEVAIDRRQKISVRIQPDVKLLDIMPKIVFIFGGPGSKKGRVVDDLVSSYGFQFVSMEDLILTNMPIKMSNVLKLETVRDISHFLRDDPKQLALSWMLDTLQRHVEKNQQAMYLVDVLPNLKSLIRNDSFTSDCSEVMQKFEQRNKVSFALNLAVPADKALKANEIHCARPSATDRLKEGGQSDEADASRTQKRAAMYQSTAKNFLDYFSQSDRLVTVDVSCGQGDFIWNRVLELFTDLNFESKRTVNTVLLFAFDNDELAEIDHQKFELEHVSLKSVAENANDTVENLLSCVAMYVDNHKTKQTNGFLIDVIGTSINKDAVNKFPLRSIMYVDKEENYIETLMWATPKSHAQSAGCKPYQAVCSTENEVCLFPKDCNTTLCKNMTLQLTLVRKIK